MLLDPASTTPDAVCDRGPWAGRDELKRCALSWVADGADVSGVRSGPGPLKILICAVLYESHLRQM